MKCRFIDTGFNAAYTNMAIDEAILHFCKIPTLRVYAWKPSAISIGYSQNAAEEVNIERCRENNINIVRRITGGKAVLHEKEVTYSFMAPENAGLLPRSITESYRTIATALIIALREIGIGAKIKKQPCKAATPLCFNSMNWYELIVNNKKISGSAQRRVNGRVLQHGSLLIDFNYEKNLELFNLCDGFDDIKNLKMRITSIKNELGMKISYKRLAEAIRHGFRKNFSFDAFNGKLDDAEMKLAKLLEKEKYSREEWNFKDCIKEICVRG